jgi:hypothetical protein
MPSMRRILISLGLLLAVTAAACSGDDSDSQVASVDSEEAAETDGEVNGASDSEVTEDEMLEYTECLRGQGLDVEDPVVDADGNVSFGGFGGGVTPGSAEFTALMEQLQDAQEACGEPPGGGFAGRTGDDQTELQDTMLEFARCMRDNGYDMPDPDFSGLDSGTPGEGGGPFGGEVDRDDPAFQEAFEACGDLLAGFGPGGTGGEPQDESEGE